MKNIFKLTLIISLFFLAACAVQKRTPSGALPDQNIKSCGIISSNETSRSALDTEDVLYTLQIDCNNDGKLNPEDGHVLTAFEYSEVKPQQKKWLKELHKKAVSTQMKAAALPYVCVKYQAEVDPCPTFKNTYGVNPKFATPLGQGLINAK